MTDISWEYDPSADFPHYPINLLADLNSLVASMLHGNYYPADMNGPRAFPDTTVGNITYVTLAPPHLPLLLPLYYLGFPKPLLDLVEPALTVMVDWGYNRSISPGTPRTAQLIPRVNPCTAISDLGHAVIEGVQNFVGDLKTAHAAPSLAKPARVGSARTPAIEDRATPTSARTVRDPVTAVRATPASLTRARTNTRSPRIPAPIRRLARLPARTPRNPRVGQGQAFGTAPFTVWGGPDLPGRLRCP